MLVDIALYFFHAFPKESSGSVAARTKRKFELVAENGVRVWLKQKERDEVAEICRVINKVHQTDRLHRLLSVCSYDQFHDEAPILRIQSLRG